MVTKAETLYAWFKNSLSVFEKKHHIEHESVVKNLHDHIVLIGAHRLGQYMLKFLDPRKIVIVEFDPEVVRSLQGKKYRIIFGDIADPDIIERCQLSTASIVVSTIPSLEENLGLLNHINKNLDGNRPSIIVNAQHEWEARLYYKHGATYVLFPHFLGAQHLSLLFKHGKWDKKTADEFKRHDLAILKT